MAEVSANQEMTREEVATYLREFADELSANDHRGDGTPRDESNRGGETDERSETDAERGEHRHEDANDSAERVREERTDAAERMRDDSDDESGTDESTPAESTHGTGDTGRPAGGKVTFMVGNESATINPPGRVEFEMAVDSDSSLMSSGTRETVAFELHWNSEAVDGDDELDVQ